MKPTGRQLQALDALERAQPATAAEWLRAASLSERTFFHALAALVEGGWVCKGGKGRGAVYAVVDHCKITATDTASATGAVLFADLLCMAMHPAQRLDPTPRAHLQYITTVYGARVRWTGRILSRTDEVRHRRGKVYIPAVCLDRHCRMVTEYELVPPDQTGDGPAPVPVFQSRRPQRVLAPDALARLAARREAAEAPR